MRKRLFTIVATLLWMAFIFWNSLQSGTKSAAASGRFVTLVEQALAALGLFIRRDLLSLLIRKGAHFFEYFILGLLSRNLFVGMPRRKWLAVLLFCLTTAFADELIQNLAPGRGPSLLDVGIDEAGAALSLIFSWLLRRKPQINS